VCPWDAPVILWEDRVRRVPYTILLPRRQRGSDRMSPRIIHRVWTWHQSRQLHMSRYPLPPSFPCSLAPLSSIIPSTSLQPLIHVTPRSLLHDCIICSISRLTGSRILDLVAYSYFPVAPRWFLFCDWVCAMYGMRQGNIPAIRGAHSHHLQRASADCFMSDA
jgi:hypothetical protein